MNATVVDLRYRMSEVLKALDRNERVTVLYHGKVKGVITPARGASHSSVTNHPFFRMRTDATSVDAVMSDLRGGRHHDL